MAKANDEELEADKANQLEIAYNAMRRHYSEGDPVKGGTIQDLITAGSEIPPDLLYFGEIKPTGGKISSLDIEIPPWVGKGSGNDVWRAFAKQVSDTPEDVIDRMDRNDIQALLVSLRIIPAKENGE